MILADPRNKARLQEPLRMYEALFDYFMYGNIYGSTDELWQKYFYYFTYAAALQRGR